MPFEPGNLSQLQAILDQANRGDDEARTTLVTLACEQMSRLVRLMLRRRYPRLRRWEETDDVLQQTWLRLQRSLAKLRPATALEFHRLAATEIRWELIDLYRRHFGAHGIGANYDSHYGNALLGTGSHTGPEPEDDTAGPAALAGWAEFHEQVEQLPDEVREVFDLIWYQQVSQEDAASLLGVSVRTIKRRWQRAKLLLHNRFGGQPPG